MAAPTAATGQREPGAATEVEPGWPTLAGAVGAGFVLWGLLIGLQPLHDNSFLTHLATGRIIVDRGVIPRTDPYSFTAHGDPWVVQSWLASLAYGTAERIGGLDGIRVLNALLVAGLAAIVWQLAAGARLLPRVVVAAFVTAIGVGVWVERPLLIGLVAMGLVLLLAQGRGDPRWAVPIMWVWVNSHGSFPLGLLAVGLLAVGAWLDDRRRGTELRLLAWMVVGTLLGAINPLGPRLLLFPLEVLHKSDSFRAIEEWQPLRISGVWALLFVAQILVAVALLVRTRSWRTALPLVVFTGLALTSARNVAVASLVVVPGMAACAAGIGSVDGRRRSRGALAVVAVCVVAGCVFGITVLRGPDTRLDAYPEDAVTWLEAQGRLDDHLITPDYVGNYLEARYGPKQYVFVDDRVDMYPPEVVDDSITLLRATPGWSEVLDHYEAGVVLWPREKPLTRKLLASPTWKPVYKDADWYAFERR